MHTLRSLAVCAVMLAGADMGRSREIVISPEAIRQCVEARLREATAGIWAETAIEFRTMPPEVRLSGKGATLRPAIAHGARLRGLISVPVAVVLDGEVTQTLVVQCLLRSYEDVFMVMRPVERHGLLREEDLSSVRTETTRSPEENPVKREDLRKLRARHALRPGTVLWARSTERIPVVQIGDPITIRVRSGGVQVRAAGLAQEDGAEGDLVMVSRGGSARLRARVVGPRLVELFPEQN